MPSKWRFLALLARPFRLTVALQPCFQITDHHAHCPAVPYQWQIAALRRTLQRALGGTAAGTIVNDARDTQPPTAVIASIRSQKLGMAPKATASLACDGPRTPLSKSA